MSARPQIVIGDHAYFECTLWLNRARTPSLAGATVSAAIIGRHDRALLAGPVAVTSGLAGSDWANRVVVTPFEPEHTEGLQPGRVVIEIQTIEAGLKSTWFEEIEVVRGAID